MTFAPTGGPSGPERIARFLARAGLCSRREAEAWIAAGRVAVNGETLRSPARNVGPGDRVTVDGKPIKEKEKTRLWLYHKPPGLVTTHRDPQGRPTVFAALPEGMPRVVSVGRLDVNSEGLLLLTNDGGLAGRLERSDLPRRYRVRVFGHPDPKRLKALARGVTVDGVRYDPVQADTERATKSHAWLRFTLTEGKNREIRHLCEHLDAPVTRLIRIAYGPFDLGDLERGEVKESTPTLGDGILMRK